MTHAKSPRSTAEQAQLTNHMLGSLRSGQVVTSFLVRLIREADIARLAATAGFDSLYVDLEHSSISLAECSAICVAALESGVTPLVRISSVDDIGTVLDGGALGVVAPHINTADDARRIVEACKYPPHGRRSHATRLPHFRYQALGAAAAQAALDAATAVVVQIESAESLKNAGAIAAVSGVDVLLVGTNDLAGDLGIAGEYDNPQLEQAYATVVAACRASCKFAGVGGLAWRADLIARFVEMGARYVSAGNDLGMLVEALTKTVAGVRKISEGVAG